MKERDQALEDLQSVETAFSDLHQRYERVKGVVEGFKKVGERGPETSGKVQDNGQGSTLKGVRGS